VLDGKGKGAIMTRTPLLIMLVAAAALAGCKKENHTIVAGPPGEDTNVAAKAPVALPPSISASKTYRCADNKIVYVDWLSDNKSANIRTDKAGSPTQVTAAEAGKAMTGPDGYSIDGTASAKSVKIGVPGHPAQSCNA
jgi:hypothetical protein